MPDARRANPISSHLGTLILGAAIFSLLLFAISLFSPAIAGLALAAVPVLPVVTDEGVSDDTSTEDFTLDNIDFGVTKRAKALVWTEQAAINFGKIAGISIPADTLKCIKNEYQNMVNGRLDASAQHRITQQLQATTVNKPWVKWLPWLRMHTQLQALGHIVAQNSSLFWKASTWLWKQHNPTKNTTLRSVTLNTPKGGKITSAAFFSTDKITMAKLKVLKGQELVKELCSTNPESLVFQGLFKNASEIVTLKQRLEKDPKRLSEAFYYNMAGRLSVLEAIASGAYIDTTMEYTILDPCAIIAQGDFEFLRGLTLTKRGSGTVLDLVEAEPNGLTKIAPYFKAAGLFSRLQTWAQSNI